MPGPEMALCSGNKALAYEVYRERTGQLAGFLKNRLGIQREWCGCAAGRFTLTSWLRSRRWQRLDLGYTVLGC
ncbi:hypothetical protein P7H19_12795 [Paenibacillus larvae]|nr:hypothetical protein [Paenibacillus larvae]MDT2236999.1 hypothetical protein [Paenibacillus larvae]